MYHAILRDHQVLPALSQRDRSPAAIPESGVRCPCIPHPFATNQTLGYPAERFVRLACLSHAASVRSEPGSNSSLCIVGTAPANRNGVAYEKKGSYTHLLRSEDMNAWPGPNNVRPGCTPIAWIWAPDSRYATSTFRNCACGITSSQQCCTVYLSKSEVRVADSNRGRSPTAASHPPRKQ